MARRHIILFRLYDDVSDEVRDEALAKLRALKDEPGVLDWRVELSLDERKGTVIVEDTTFENAEAVEAFRTSPAHQETAELMASIADWLVGDYDT